MYSLQTGIMDPGPNPGMTEIITTPITYNIGAILHSLWFRTNLSKQAIFKTPTFAFLSSLFFRYFQI